MKLVGEDGERYALPDVGEEPEHAVPTRVAALIRLVGSCASALNTEQTSFASSTEMRVTVWRNVFAARWRKTRPPHMRQTKTSTQSWKDGGRGGMAVLQKFVTT